MPLPASSSTEPSTPDRVLLGGPVDQGLRGRVGPHLGHHLLEDGADPPGAQRLPAGDPGRGEVVGGHHGDTEIGTERLGHRPDDRPTRAVPVPQRGRLGAGHGDRVVVLDDQQAGAVPEAAPQGPGPLGADRRPGRVLPPRRDDEGIDSEVHDPVETVVTADPHPVVVHAYGCGAQAERTKQVEQRRKAGVLDADQIARAEMGHQDPFDPVEGSAHHGQMVARDAVGLEVARGRVEQVRVVDGGVVVRGRRLGPAGQRAKPRQQPGVGMSGAQIDQAGGYRLISLGHQPGEGEHGRSSDDPRALAALALYQALTLEVTVGRGDGGRADDEVLGQATNRRQPIARGHAALDDGAFHAGRDLPCRAALRNGTF